jgi:hypothetical protein
MRLAVRIASILSRVRMCCCKVTHSVFFPFAKLCFIYQHAHEVTRAAAAAAAASA